MILRFFVLKTWKRWFFRPFDQKNPFVAVVGINRELHGEKSERSCRHIEFITNGARVRYVRKFSYVRGFCQIFFSKSPKFSKLHVLDMKRVIIWVFSQRMIQI